MEKKLFPFKKKNMYLHPYEDLHRKLGDSLLVSSQGSKRSSESKRMFNARYLAPIQKKTQTRTSRKTVDTEPSNNNTETADEAQSVIQDNDSVQDDLSQQTEELTLSGMVKNLNENFRKAKKEKEKETKSKCNSKSKPKIRRTSVDKASRKSNRSCDENEDFEEQDEEEEEDEPKRRKRNKKTDEASEESGSTISVRVSKRKSSTGKIDDTESDQTDTKMFALSQIELNKVVEVRYGSGKNTYHAKIVKIDTENETLLVHYLGWNNRYDEWIHLRQIIKIFSDDYGAFKRRKLIKQESTDSASKIKIETKNSKITKRSSLSSISSSSSAETKKDAELKMEKKPAKSRSSESGSSLVSSECNAGEKNSDCADKKMVTTETKAESLLSIKEEIMDYEQQVLEHSDKVSFIQTITDEIVDKCMGLVEYMPRSVCTKEELMPVFSSDMAVCESSQFKEKLQLEMVESGEKKSALNETNLNNVNQSVAVCEIKVHKEKENSKHDVSKFPYHLTGCSLVGKHKIKFIEEQMRLCREEYAKLKNELAAIDRKRKKLKRNMLEKSASSLNVDDNVRHELKK
ncbi:AT-rich interactive domain-containing 4B [Brachionus plicatilis]|uniref:AT-rich interactive domain-containing 4B n=1 Tax=Brachionus plicatilis TaxID=10195 RepID=A0A3M7PWA6_BRAPC|nr:AT-rich interactive domain-containing 4B [Brachionus plicatilis]